MKETDRDAIRRQVREHYADIARTEGRCCGGKACCSPDPLPDPDTAIRLGYSREEITGVPDGANMGLGCGNPQALAALRPGETVLDLGSGGGLDCFLAARQVGPSGAVLGVDMTPEMVSRARANAARGGFDRVEFRLGEIEHLPVADDTADVILSNCVINLSPDKPQVFREMFRVLRPGGRIAVSDVVAIGQIPGAVKSNLRALSGCVAQAASAAEIERWLREAGFSDIRIRLNEDSWKFIQDWFPGSGAEKYVRSAAIEARKETEA